MIPINKWPGNSELLAIAAGLGALGVVSGAFGAHFLKDSLEAAGHLETWKTAVFYNLVHTVAVVSFLAFRSGSRASAYLWLAGIVLFSGSLHALALGGPRWLGPVTPVGGVFLVLGWVVAGVAALRQRQGGDT
jgi:uncharacterized membrane protein YgdD (TMEM256/DUF423 family)